MRRSNNKNKRRWGILAGVAIAALAFLLGGYIYLSKTIDHLLSDGALLHLIGKRTAVTLKADSGYLSLSRQGLTVRSQGLLVRGKPPRSLREMEAIDLRGECSLEDLWQRKFTIKRLSAARMDVAFGSAAAKKITNILPAQPELQPQEETPRPLKLVISETIIQETNIFWGEQSENIGTLRGVTSIYYPRDSELDVIGTGGVFQQTGWPELQIAKIEAHYGKPRLLIRSGNFTLGKDGTVLLTGELNFGEQGEMQLETQGHHLPAEPFLKGFWRGKFDGAFDGDAKIEKKFAQSAKASAAGELNFTHAEVHNVATLNQIALLTHHPEFEHLRLSQLRGNYKWSGERLEVSDLRMEAKNLFRVDGQFSIEDRRIDGKFKIGTTADVLKTIPGAREKVFTEAHDGYLWTSMSLSGPMSHPHEDLKQRLVSAAEEQLGKSFLAPIFKPGQELLKLLGALYE